ncbi:hypothetical protein [uncultured Methanoregula sp.]|uniref:hypothetical protein n=1 Tax=uncultured Methanoregula sp. TaxID=1005933 RepID=UPI002AABE970|nr:hypothetical protein [uncultured Methanoregula sp.]
MFERQERLAILLLVGVAIVVISAHFVLTYIGKQPFARPFSETSADGELVYTEGQIDQVTLTKEGDYALIRMGNTTLFTQSRHLRTLGLQKGDLVFVYGIVQTYHGKKELVVNAPEDFRRMSQENRSSQSADSISG